jgi:hypothetical protein
MEQAIITIRRDELGFVEIQTSDNSVASPIEEQTLRDALAREESKDPFYTTTIEMPRVPRGEEDDE